MQEEEDEEGFTRVCSARVSGNGFKLKEGVFRLNIRQKFFSVTALAAVGEGVAVGMSGHWEEAVPAEGGRDEPSAGISPALKSLLHILCHETQP